MWRRNKQLNFILHILSSPMAINRVSYFLYIVGSNGINAWRRMDYKVFNKTSYNINMKEIKYSRHSISCPHLSAPPGLSGLAQLASYIYFIQQILVLG